MNTKDKFVLPWQQPQNKQLYNSGCYVIAHKQQQRNGVFCVAMLMAVHGTMECHATAKQHSHCNRVTVFSTWSVQKCYKQDNQSVSWLAGELDNQWGSVTARCFC
jgi:hypothetical protein